MRVAVISDIHGNYHALEAVLAEIDRAKPREIWCLGDLVGYGPRPNRCTKEAAMRMSVCLAGNHDLGVTGAIPLEQFSRGAAIAAHDHERHRGAELELGRPDLAHRVRGARATK